MSIVNRENVDGIMDRIEVATVQSPMAVFQHITITEDGLHEPDFEMLFEKTVFTEARLKYNPVGLVGVFYNDVDDEESLGRIKSFFENYETNPVWEK